MYMDIYRRSLKKYNFNKIPNYLMHIYEKLYCNDNIKIDFTYRNVIYLLTKTKFDKVSLLSKIIENKKINLALIGPLKIIKNISILSTKNKTAVIGTFEIGKKTKAKENYMVEYMNNYVYIKKNSNIWINKDDKIIIGWHGTYNPPKGM